MADIGQIQDQASEPDLRGALPGYRGSDPVLRSQGPQEVALPEGVRPLELDAEKANRLASKMLSIPGLFDDRFGGVNGLARLVLTRTTIMLELGNEDGIMYAEDVFPGGYATAHITVFNRRRLPELDNQIQNAVKWLFATFRPSYLSAWVPETNRNAIRLVQRLGWQLDGVIRGALLYEGKRRDAWVYSISIDEALNGQQEDRT